MSFLKKQINKKHIIIALILSVTILLSMFSKVFSMQHYQTVDFITGIVTASTLNVRQGPGITYKTITQIKKNEYVRVFAQVGNWYIIQTDKDYVGAVSVDYIRGIKPTETDSNSNTGEIQNVTPSKDENTTELTEDEKEVLNLINAERQKAGLKPLEIDDEVQNVARIKAKDMVDNSYFSHTSPNYGSPFEMLKNFKITYRTAGENIAGNSSNQAAVNAWMNSQGHKENILNSAYNYTGIGILKSSVYGNIYVQMFIGR